MTDEKVYKMRYRDMDIIQSNELIRAKQDDLTLLETKIIRLVIAQVLQNDTDFKTYTCNVIELADVLKLDRYTIYKEMDVITTDLLRKVIKIEDDTTNSKKKNWKKFHWVDYAEYNNGTLTLRLSESLKPYLLNLFDFYTSYDYRDIISLPTENSIRLFELLCSYRNMIARSKSNKKELFGVELDKNEFIFDIEYLRQYFNCENKYKKTSDFLRRVINPSIEGMKSTGHNITYRVIKERRITTHLVFRYRMSWDK